MAGPWHEADPINPSLLGGDLSSCLAEISDTRMKIQTFKVLNTAAGSK